MSHKLVKKKEENEQNTTKEKKSKLRNRKLERTKKLKI